MRTDETNLERADGTQPVDSGESQNGSKKARKSVSNATRTVKSLPRRLLLRLKAKEHSPEKRDNTPVELPTLQRPPDLREEMRRFIREEISKRAEEAGEPSFEEEDDFEINESEIDLGFSDYTLVDMAPEEGFPVDDLEGDPKAPPLSPEETPPRETPEGNPDATASETPSSVAN